MFDLFQVKLSCIKYVFPFKIFMFLFFGNVNNDDKRMKNLVQLFKLNQVLQSALYFSVLFFYYFEVI